MAGTETVGTEQLPLDVVVVVFPCKERKVYDPLCSGTRSVTNSVTFSTSPALGFFHL